MPLKTRKRASVVVVRDGKLLTVLLEDPHTKITKHFLPGGKIENGETAKEAAIRETFEETGFHISIMDVSPTVSTYPFCWNNELIECTTSYFSGICDNDAVPSKVDDATYNKGIEWLPLEMLEEYLGFDANIFSSINEIIKKHFDCN